MNPRDVKKQAAKFLPTSIISILGPSPNFTILSTAVRPNGTPVIQLSDGLAHSYDAALCAWTKLSEPWSGGTRAALEGAIAERTNVTLVDGHAEKVRPAWWGAAIMHLESRLHAACALDSPLEYKQALLLYAKLNADEGFRGKTEELVRD